ncbi:MAG: carboxypeptidase-like regulatory domain-containing protein [Bacteroidota bacterium]
MLLLLAGAVAAQPIRPGVELPATPDERPSGPPVRLEATVLDADTGDPLAGATAQVQGTTIGTSANGEGRLTLDVPATPATVVVRFVGYASAQVPLSEADAADGVVRRTIRLSPAPYVLGEVTVTDEPPGEVLWRRLLARRQQLASTIQAYAGEAYSRFLLLRDGVTDVRPVGIGLEETVSNLSWVATAGLREEVVARRRRPFGGPFKWARMGPFPDLYFEDVLLLDGVPIPSPTRADALRYYAFRIGETIETDGLRYLDLAVIPRRSGLLSGRIRIVDSLLVIAEADLRVDPGPRGGPVDDFDASYHWTYAPSDASPVLGDSLWLPGQFEREGTVTVNMPGYRVPTVRFRQTSVMDYTIPGYAGQALSLRQRYRNPRSAYEGYEVFRTGRAAVPLDSLESAVDASEWVRQSELAELLRPQEGVGIGLFGLTLRGGVEGEDDD